MPEPSVKVGIIVDKRFGPRIDAFANTFHIWVIASPLNDSFIKSYWHKRQINPVTDAQDCGVTSFDSDAQEPPETACARIAFDVDEHHGEYSQGLPWFELEIFGTGLSRHLQSTFEQIGATYFESTRDGFVCKRLGNTLRMTSPGV